MLACAKGACERVRWWTESSLLQNNKTHSVQVQPIHDEIEPCHPNNIRYLRIAEHTEYSAGIFVFPPFARMPLHDHPGMCVLSRLLYGDVQRTQLDLPEDASSRWPSFRLRRRQVAYRHEPDHLQAPACCALYPTQGNLHEFVAGPQGAAMLDVLVPPYDDDDDRDCTFYKIEEMVGDGSNRCYISVSGQNNEYPCLNGTYRRWRRTDSDE